MSGSSRSMQRRMLLKEFKKMVKDMPKKQRPSFSKVYKQMKQNNTMPTKTLPTGEVVSPTVEDVDMSELDDLFVDIEEETNELKSS